jgi:hypothetical protein
LHHFELPSSPTRSCLGSRSATEGIIAFPHPPFALPQRKWHQVTYVLHGISGMFQPVANKQPRLISNTSMPMGMGIEGWSAYVLPPENGTSPISPDR